MIEDLQEPNQKSCCQGYNVCPEPETCLLLRYNPCSNNLETERGVLNQIQNASGRTREWIIGAKQVMPRNNATTAVIVYTENMGAMATNTKNKRLWSAPP